MTGVLNPNTWLKREREAAAAEEAPKLDAADLPKTVVRYEGMARVLYVDVPSLARTQENAARMLGEAIAEITRRWPDCWEAFERQSLFRSVPLQPMVRLDLGPVILYAAAGSMVQKQAFQMAVDRVAFALGECRVRHPDVTSMLKTRGIVTTTR